MNTAGQDPDSAPPSTPSSTAPSTPQSGTPPRGHRRGHGRRAAEGVAWLPPARRHTCYCPVNAVLILNLVVTLAVLVILLIRP